MNPATIPGGTPPTNPQQSPRLRVEAHVSPSAYDRGGWTLAARGDDPDELAELVRLLYPGRPWRIMEGRRAIRRG